MATITAVEQSGRFDKIQKIASVVWEALTATDTVGSAFEWPPARDRSVQVVGNFGTGGHLVVEGSNDGTNYKTLTDPQGNALDFSAAGLEQIMELTRYIRPRISAGSGAIDLDVFLLVVRS